MHFLLEARLYNYCKLFCFDGLTPVLDYESQKLTFTYNAVERKKLRNSLILSKEETNRLIESGYIKILFNCSELNYVSSTGIGAFTSFLKSVKQKRGDVVLSFLQPKVYEVFQLLGFSKFFNITTSLDEAGQILSGQKQEEKVKSNFPKIFRCPICKKNLKASRAGRFRCSECKTILNIDEESHVFLG